MEIGLRDEGKWTRVILVGRLDAFSYEPIRQKLSLIQKIGRLFIIVDVGDTAYISYQIASLFSKVRRRLKLANGDLRVEAHDRRIIDKLNSFEGLSETQ